MGLDGFSMGNLGLHRELTSAQMSNQAEHLATRGSDIKVKDVSSLAADKGIERREEGFSGGGGFSDGKSKEEQEQDEENAVRALLSQKELESKDPKEFSVRIDPSTEMIELYNNKDKRVVETISANDLMGLISKLDSASGILVNRKI